VKLQLESAVQRAAASPRLPSGGSARATALAEWMGTDLESNHLVKSIVLTRILAVAEME
jgi:hypothetical protein